MRPHPAQWAQQFNDPEDMLSAHKKQSFVTQLDAEGKNPVLNLEEDMMKTGRLLKKVKEVLPSPFFLWL